jgi:alkaline phosphatase D
MHYSPGMPDDARKDRRRLLQLATATATTLWLPRALRAQPRLAENPFSLGVASGSPADTSVVLWTRLAGDAVDGLGKAAVSVDWELAHDEAFARPVHKGQALAGVELGRSVHVEVPGLQPDRWYFYRFTYGGWTSPVGRTRTLPAPDAMPARLRIGYASCQRWEHGFYAAWRHLRADQPDLVLFLGDYIYEYPGAWGAVRWPADGLWVTSLDDYRQRHALYKSDPDLQAMHAACPWLTTWDDHEVQNDYAGLQAGTSGPPLADFPARRAAAYQAYYEHMPLRAGVLARSAAAIASGGALRMHSAQRFGRLAHLCLLDTRQHRSAPACPRGNGGGSQVDPAHCEALKDPGRTLLGAAQEAWLDAQLAQGGATWTVLGQSTLFGQRDNKPGEGRLLWNDGWDGYGPARARLTGSLRRHGAPNPVILGGDVHEHWVGHVKADYADPASANVGVEFCGTSISSRSGGADRAAERLAENPHFIYGNGRSRGYGLAEFTPSRLTVTLRGVDDVERADSGASTLARFTVAAGRPLLEKA